MFYEISIGRVIAWDPLNSQVHSLICHKNGADDDMLFIIVIKEMELTVHIEIDLFAEKNK